MIGLCPTTGGAANSAANPEQVAGFMMKLKNHILDEFHIATGRTWEEIAEAQEHQRVFTAEEALGLPTHRPHFLDAARKIGRRPLALGSWLLALGSLARRRR